MTTNNLPAVAVPYNELREMGVVIAKSGLFGMKTPEQAIALLLVAQSEGLHPAVAAMSYDIIQGRPAKKTEAMMRDFLRGGGKVEWHTLTDAEAAATFSHPQGGSVRIDWDMKRAKAAGIGGKDMWLKYPRQMLRSRCVSEGIRTVFPLATSGMYVPEENADMEPRQAMRDVTPPISRKPADDLAEFAGEHPAPPAATDDGGDSGTRRDPDIDAETGEIIDRDDRPYAIPLAVADGATDWAAFCAAMKAAMNGAEDEDTLLAVMEQNKDAMMTLSGGGKGGRAAADRLRAVFNGQQIELRRRAAVTAND